ncbi:formate dehydrogenase accessory sulfurtransferase FdhD [Haliea sp.]
MQPEQPDPPTAAEEELPSSSIHTWREGELSASRDTLADETPVALVYNCVSHAVMMASASDLEDFALGFSLGEGIVEHPGQIYDIEVCLCEQGIELRIALASDRLAALKDRRRFLAGQSGCGLCGVESLDYFAAPVPTVSDGVRISHRAVQRALAALPGLQRLGGLTGGMHAAAWCDPAGDILLLREDVGRHNALDKLVGALATHRPRPAGFALVSSRASYELVQKAARADMAVLVAVSAATSRAVDAARQCGMTLVGFARPGRQVVYAGGERLD